MSPLSPRLHYLLQLLVVVASPSSSCSGLGASRFVFILCFSLFFSFLYLFLCVSQPKMSRGVVLYGHMT